jgi:hypothetical protein
MREVPTLQALLKPLLLMSLLAVAPLELLICPRRSGVKEQMTRS